MTLREWLDIAARLLEEKGFESGRLEAQILAAHGLEKDRAWILANPDYQVPLLLDALLERRFKWEPLAYIVGAREFYGRSFNVTPAVLIPRQDTETLVEAALSFVKSRSTATVLDLGTGSGAIAVTVALEAPAAKVTACDISNTALHVARDNAERLGAAVKFIESDWFSKARGSFDLLLCNPPYISNSEQLPKDVMEEPKSALFSGETGLEAYEVLAREATGHLNPRGRFMVEIGSTQAAQVERVFAGAGWDLGASHRDLPGHVRVLEFQLRS